MNPPKPRKLTPECFKQLVNEVKAETGAKGKELFHPIRLVVTGSHSGPEFDKLIPILEEGSRLNLPRHVLSVRERVKAFAKAARNKVSHGFTDHADLQALENPCEPSNPWRFLSLQNPASLSIRYAN